MSSHGIEGRGQWVLNSVSSLARFWSCGMVSRNPDVPAHDHDPKELKRCRTLARRAAAVIGPEWPLLGSGTDPVTEPFFVTAQRRAAVPERVTARLIRTILGGALHPAARVVIEPLTEGTDWWRETERAALEWIEKVPKNATSAADALAKWLALMRWFPANDLAAPAFVRTTDSRRAVMTLGCVFPCFIVGITDKGSLVGVTTIVVE